MSDYSPVGARAHVSQSGRGALETGVESEALIFAEDDAAFTRPVPILAERRVGETELSVFPLALGTARLAAVDEVAAERILHRFATRGGSLYDVSDDDGSGRSQELVAAWLAGNRPSKALTLLTPSVERDGERASGPNRLVRAVEAALRRLRLARIDLLVLDLSEAARLDLGLEQLLGAADELVAAGKVRHLGAVGASGDALLEARVLAGNGLPRIVAVRLDWDITGKSTDDAEMRMVAAAQQLSFLPDATAASLALASPSLPPKVLAGWGRSARLSQAMNARVVKPEPERAADVLAGRGREHRIGVALDRVSAELGAPPATTQLAWLLAKRGVVAPIVQVTRPEQVDLLMDAAAVRLTRAQMLELDRAVETVR
ncbi:aldo/keto reductase [Gryllotalpicola koreensis]|uniref:Aldo/keto reductase n=1 Tax=Gryllotalpicola koreensis TaxID=993086 RepID=A0ABP8ABF4_9MICO